MDKIQKFLKKHVKIVKPLYTKVQTAYWNASISGKEEDFKEYELLTKKLAKIYNNKEEFEKIKSFKEQEIQNSSIKRQIQILYNEYLSSQGDLKIIEKIIEKETKVEQKFNTFRAKIDDKELTDNQIKEILKTELDSGKLQAAWESSKKQGELVESELIEIVKLRNQMAQSLSFNNYYEKLLVTSEQNLEEIQSIFKELDNLTKKPFQQLKDKMDLYLSKRHSIAKEELKPWHYQDLFFQEGPKIYKVNLDKIYSQKDIVEIIKEFYKSIGLEVQNILESSSLYEQPGKSQHGFCIDINREGDTRILENVKNDEHWTDTTLHELGHGVYNIYFDSALPFLLKNSAHTFITEAVAMLFGRQAKNTSFIKSYFDVNKKEIETLSEDIADSLKLRQLVFSRWAQVMFNFEKELYKNPDQNLNKLWYELIQKYQLIPFSRDKPDWASKIHFVCAPVYYHNYMLGELLASQIHHKIVHDILNKNSLKNIDYTKNKEIGDYLINSIFKIGKKYVWNEMIEKSTGEKLTPKYFVEEFIK